MADMLFKCTNCSKVLAIDGGCLKQSVNCTDCGCALVVPAADVEYRCPHCRVRLGSPSNMAGTLCSCPSCEKDLNVPFHTPQLNLLQRHAVDSEQAVENQCPVCGASVAPAALLCLNCGIDFRTGRPSKKKRFARAVDSVLFYWAAVSILLAMALGGWHYRTLQKAAEDDRIMQLQAQAAHAEKVAMEHAERQQAESERLKAEADRLHAKGLKDEREKAEAEQMRLRMAELRERFLDSPEVGLLDALAQISLDRNIRIAIDPDVISVAGSIRVKPADLTILADPGKRYDWLGKRGFVIRSCPISARDTNCVDLVTTESIWAYSRASQQLRNGQLAKALQSLETARIDDSEFGRHCLALSNLLRDLIAQQAEANDLAMKIRRNLADCGTYQKAAQMYSRGVEMSGESVSSRRVGDHTVQEAMAKSNYEQALKTMRAVCADMETFKRKVITCGSDLSKRYTGAYDANLHTEAKFLVDGYIESISSLRMLYAEIERTGLLTDVKTARYYGMEEPMGSCARDAREFGKDLVEVPEGVRRSQGEVDEWVKVSSGQADGICLDAATRDEIVRGTAASGRSLVYDRGNLLARAAAGYFRMQLHGRMLRDLLKGENDGSARLQALTREFASGKKNGMFCAAREVGGQTAVAHAIAGNLGKIGLASGLFVMDFEDRGEILPVSVQIKPITHTTFSRTVSVQGNTGVVTPHVGVWETWGASVRSSYEVSSKNVVWEDYGDKDSDMRIAANETYLWLCNAFPRNMQEQAIHITFHHLKEGKSGDSAGVAMATAAYSSISNRPVRADVAITGSIRSDGSVLGVGGIFEKIRGSAAAPLVEIVVIPRANEGDAMLVPLDDMCRITVISADDIATYLNYATDKAYRQPALMRLRKAQIHLLTGRRDLAEPLLLEVAAECPENFTARRLLELIAFCKRFGQTDVASANPL